MSNDHKPDDLESTIRLDSKQAMDPYSEPSPTSIDSIEDVFAGDQKQATEEVYELPEEAIVSTEDSLDLTNLNNEANEISNEFEFNILDEEATETIEASTTENKPIDKNITDDATSTEQSEEPPVVSDTNQNLDNNSASMNIDEKEMINPPVNTAPNPPATTPAKKASSGTSIAMLLIALIALAAGSTGTWVSMSLQAQVDELYNELSAVHNERANYLHELTETQKQLAILKQELNTLQLKHVESVTKIEPKTTIITPAKTSPTVAITPTTPIKEVKPSTKKNTWNVIISSHNSRKKAELEQKSKAIRGLQTHIVAVTVKGKNWYRLVANGFTSKEQAVNFTHKLKKSGITDAWIQRNK